MRAQIGNHAYGCDICQDVCPWNRKAPRSANPAFDPKPGLFWPEIDRLLELTDDDWRRMIRGTALKRAKIKGLLRNLMVVAGNSGVRSYIPKLQRFLGHEDEHVRTQAEWAVKKLEGS
jgi:epoxyqueuosine reductase